MCNSLIESQWTAPEHNMARLSMKKLIPLLMNTLLTYLSSSLLVEHKAEILMNNNGYLHVNISLKTYC